MRQLSIPRRGELRDDRGAVAVITAIFLSLTLFGLGMFAVDYGQAYDEHRQLRNAADAAAVAVAQSCARSTSTTTPCTAGTSGSSLAGLAANANSDDNATVIDRVCGTAPGLPVCPAPAPGGSVLSTCPPAPSSGPFYVEAWTRTGTPDGKNSLDPLFATAPTVVRACARAAYGAPRTMTSFLPITVPACMVVDYKADHEPDFAPLPPYSPNDQAYASYEVPVYLKGGPSCKSSAGPGNFGWLDTNGTVPCQTVSIVNNTVGGSPGNGNPGSRGCSDAYMTSLLGTVIYLPVYTASSGNGANLTYTVGGYMGLYFTGWSLSGSSHASTITGKSPCGKPNTCISGFFVRGLLPTPGDLAPAGTVTGDYGVLGSKLLG